MEKGKQEQAALASQVDCFTARELCVLAGITEGTEVAWRKRGMGPPHIVIGNAVLYPRERVKEFLRQRVHERRPAAAKSAL